MNCRSLLAISALVLAAACGSGYAPTSPVTPPTPAPPTAAPGAVTIVPNARTLGSLAYSPSPITVSAGTTVTWTNGDTATHGAVSDSGVFSSGSVAAGAKFSVTLQTPGTYPYHCPIHSSMTGSVVVQ